jgi:hypothetical protein
LQSLFSSKAGQTQTPPPLAAAAAIPTQLGRLSTGEMVEPFVPSVAAAVAQLALQRRYYATVPCNTNNNNNNNHSL